CGVDRCADTSRVGFDAHDRVSLPYVRVYRVVNTFQLVESLYRFPRVTHCRLTEHGERFRLAKSQGGAAITGDQTILGGLITHPPPFAGVAGPVELGERVPVTFDGDSGLPRQLPHAVVDHRDAFAEQVIGQFHPGLRRLTGRTSHDG